MASTTDPAAGRGRIFLRLLAGFMLAPLAPVIALAAIAAGSGSVGMVDTVPMFAWGAPIAYGAMLVLGVPSVAIARLKRWNGLWVYLIGGILVGLALSVVLMFLGPSLGSFRQTLMASLLGLIPFLVGCSFLASAAFWLIARPDRLDRSA